LIGLLRADCVEAESPLDVEGLLALGSEQGVVRYCDNHPPSPLPAGYGSAFDGATVVEASPLFHPYRLYVLYHVERVFRLNASSTQYLGWSPGMAQIVESEFKHLDEFTSRQAFRERFDHWNLVAELAIALEPLASASASGALSEHDAGGEYGADLVVIRQEAEALIRLLGQAGIREVRQELGRTAEWIDENRNLHVLLRLMSNHERHKLRGALGASMQLLAMAEVIRRAAETVFDDQLPEEDQIGLSTWLKGARQLVYGTERVFDAPRRVLRD
jgi:hypothetical protein